MPNRLIDQVIRLQMLIVWMTLTCMAKYLSNPDLRFGAEMQAMGALIVYQDLSIIPEFKLNEMRRMMKVILLGCAGLIVGGVLKGLT